MKFTCRKHQVNNLTLRSTLLLTALLVTKVINFYAFLCAPISFNDLTTNYGQVNICVKIEDM